MSETDALVKEKTTEKVSETFDLLKIGFLLGGIYVSCVVPTTLIVFTGPKIAQDEEISGFNKVTIGLCHTGFWIGFAISALIAMPLCDRIGRKIPIYVLYSIGLAAACMSACATDPLTYGLMIFVVGLTMAPSGGIAYLLMCESIPVRLCSTFTICVNVAYSLGIIAMALISKQALDVHWRIETMLWYAPVGLCLLVAGPCCVRDSPKFRTKSQACTALEDGNGSNTKGADGIGSSFQQLWERPMRRNMVATSVCWIACSMSYFGLSYASAEISTDIHMNMMLMGTIDLLGNALPGLIMSVFSPIVTQAGAFCFAGMSLMMCAFLTPGPLMSPLVICALLGRLSVNVAFTTIFILIVDRFPEECRSSAMGVANFFARASSLVAPMLATIPATISCPALGVVTFLGMFATLDLGVAAKTVD